MSTYLPNDNLSLELEETKTYKFTTHKGTKPKRLWSLVKLKERKTKKTVNVKLYFLLENWELWIRFPFPLPVQTFGCWC